ncbi:MAG TPA: extracellular solute-binding protein [Puia sp.]|nr:extracellular solute-binding protein [Puia sp.]
MRICILILAFFVVESTLPSCRNNASGGKNNILFWCSNNNQEIQFCTHITRIWNDSHRFGDVHLQPVPEGQSSEEVILAAVVGKTTPDIYANMWQGSVEMYAHAGVLVALDTLKGFMAFIKQRCDSAAIREITSSNGHIYQIPWKVNPIMTLYNKTLFERNQINQLPGTYSGYYKAAEAFKDNAARNGIPGSRFGYTEVKSIWYQRLFNFYTLYVAASDGAPLIVNNRAAFNNKYAVEVFAFLQHLYNKEYFSKESTSASADPFVMQRIATEWTGPWEISYLNNIPGKGFDFDYYPPIVPDDHLGPIFTYADPKNIVIFKSCRNPQLAWAFLETLLDRKGDLELLTTTGQLPRRKNLETDPFFSEYFRANPMMVRFAEEIPYLKGVDNCDVIVEVLDIISQEYEACVVYGMKTPERAVADAEKAVNVLLASANR